MPIDVDVIESARKLRPGAVEEILRSEVAQVYRIAYALSGRWDVGRGIARFVLNRSVRMMPRWKPDDDPDNWYHRFTIMTSRRAAKHQPEPARDVLVEQAALPREPEYVAFVAAIRQLIAQQREAFLLRHGEKLNARYLALAMDCSTQAADNHLKAAEDSMRLVAGTRFPALVRKLEDAYAHLTPDPDQLLPTVNKVVFRQVRLRRVLRRIVLLLAIVALAALIVGGWKLYQIVRR